MADADAKTAPFQAPADPTNFALSPHSFGPGSCSWPRWLGTDGTHLLVVSSGAVDSIANASGAWVQTASNPDWTASGGYPFADATFAGSAAFVFKGRNLLSFPFAGGPPTVLNPPAELGGFIEHGGLVANDGTFVYWAEPPSGGAKPWTIQKMSVAGGASALLATLDLNETPKSVAAANGYLYWDEWASGSPGGTARVKRVSGASGAVEALGDHPREMTALGMDATSLHGGSYDSTVWQRPLADGAWTKLAPKAGFSLKTCGSACVEGYGPATFSDGANVFFDATLYDPSTKATTYFIVRADGNGALSVFYEAPLGWVIQGPIVFDATSAYWMTNERNDASCSHVIVHRKMK